MKKQEIYKVVVCYLVLSMAGVFHNILGLLDENNVSYEHLQHDFVRTSQEAAQVRGVRLEQGAKALVLKDKDGSFYMFVVGGNRRLDLKKIKNDVLHVKNISLAPPHEVHEKTGCTVGSVPPFGNLFGLPVYMDKHLITTQEELVFSAGTHHDSLKMKAKDYLRVVKPIVAEYSVDLV